MAEMQNNESHNGDHSGRLPRDSSTGQPDPLTAEAGAPPADDQSSEVLQRFWQGVKRLPAYTRLATTVAKDGDVSKQAKGVLAIGGGYAVSPIDLVPGIIPVVGQLDDLYVLLTALQQSLKMMPVDVADKHLANAGVTREDIDGDLQSVRDLVRVGVKKSLVFGGKTIGRIGRAAYGFANDQFKRRTGTGSA